MTKVSLFQSDGSNLVVDEYDLCLRLENARGRITRPFSQERLNLVATVCNVILKRKDNYSPAVTHFAFFIRAAALQKLARGFEARLPPTTQARACGLVFHLPPQNVETVFLYSWVLSYICGNANIVRLPQEISREMKEICGLFLEAAEAAGDPSQLFAYYPSSSDLGRVISASSDARVVWGGDAKIAAFAPLPLRSGGKAVWFGDRFSFCVIKGGAIAEQSDSEQNDLAHRLFNDIFVFDQMACSSPHVIYVVGNQAQHLAYVNTLLEKLAQVAGLRQHIPAAGHQINKMVQAFSFAASGQSAAVNWRNGTLTSIVVDGGEHDEQKVGGGFLQIAFVRTLNSVGSLIRGHHQTITHYGFSADEIYQAADAHLGFGGTRWAPVGTALDFDFVWDGYDLPREFTRLVRLK